MKASTILLSLLATSLMIAGCSREDDRSKDQKSDSDVSIWQGGERNVIVQTLQVTDLNGRPVAGAQVLVGHALNAPFDDNFLTTDSSGTFAAPTGWNQPEAVTVAAPGFVRATYFGQTPRGQNFQLRPVASKTPNEMKGNGTGFTIKDKDDVMDFALMIPAVRKQDLFSFNIGMFISPVSDTISVYNYKVNLPSNTSIPKQKENYGIFPVTIDKPTYRIYFDELGVQRVVTLRGQFPFSTVIKELNGGKSFMSMINHFSLKGGSLKEVTLTSPATVMDLPVNELIFDQPRNFRAPNVPQDQFLLAASLSPYRGEFYPTDFKLVPSGADFSLVTAKGDQPSLLVALKLKSEENSLAAGKLSAALIPFAAGAAPVLLPLIENPQVISFNELKVNVPVVPTGLRAVASYLTMSKVESGGTGAGGLPTEKVERQWEVYAEHWPSQIHLPQWPDEKVPTGKKRWEVKLLASQQPATNNPIDLSPRVFETVTHATHSATDF